MNIFIPDIPLIEKVARAVIVYLFLLIAFRLAGKRQLGQLTPFDLVVVLIISNVLQNAMIGNDNSLGGGLLGAMVILLLNAFVAWLTFRYKWVDRIFEHNPTVLVRHGRILRENLRRERVTLGELRMALRMSGVTSLEDVRYAILEETGEVSVVTRAKRPPEKTCQSEARAV